MVTFSTSIKSKTVHFERPLLATFNVDELFFRFIFLTIGSVLGLLSFAVCFSFYFIFVCVLFWHRHLFTFRIISFGIRQLSSVERIQSAQVTKDSILSFANETYDDFDTLTVKYRQMWQSKLME